MFLLNGQRLPEDAPFTVDEVQYPANWLRFASIEEKNAIGITEVQEDPRPDDALYFVTDNNDGTYTTVEKPIEMLRDLWKAKLREKRDAHQYGGMVFNDVALQTDLDSQTKYTGATLAAMLDNTYVVNWKTANGTFVQLNAQAIIGVSEAIRAHVQGCYDREAVLTDAINSAADLGALQAIDLDGGWPAYA